MHSLLSRPHIPLLFCLLLFSNVMSLTDLQPSGTLEDRQYDRLNQQQTSLEDNINQLVQDMLNIEKNVSKTTNPSQKVLLLEAAVLSERQKVFNMGNQLIPSFSFSKTACLQLTNQQKINMLDKIKSTKTQMNALQKQIITAPKCDKITSLQKDTLKQLTLLQTLQNTIYTECESKSVLTPTIYQSNIYADGWILGDQNIDDLIEEYYQRNIRYHNITNCPLETPFFNGVKCIVCKEMNPVFNILTRQCTKCPEDLEADSNLRKCVLEPHYTNFSSADNWAQQGAPMPVPKSSILPCPAQKPYYNGKKCQVCLMPKFWSIKRNSCVECPIEQVFDVNDQKCQQPETNHLTILQGTRWVTNDCNLTRIIDERVKILNLNSTNKKYTMCPKEKPFYDAISCISCPNQFNVDTRRCVSSPSKTSVYDENMRCYLQKQSGFQTDPRSDSYTTKSPLSDSATPNCKKDRPFYDGVACISCLSPFPIFDVATKRCTNCDPMDIYDNTKRACIPRQKIYVSTNQQKLLATQKKSIQDYHAQISQKIKQNPEAVILLCKDTQYSNFESCLTCTSEQYFNVETKKCQICDGNINQTTKVCQQKAYLYTNLNSESIKRIVAVPANTTIEKQNTTIAKNLNLHINSKLCPVSQPYFDGKVCNNCTAQSFNYTSSQCVPIQCLNPTPFYNKVTEKCEACPKNMSYRQDAKKCLPVVYVTNVDSMFWYLEQDNATLASLTKSIQQQNKTNTVIVCDKNHPYFNGVQCMDCSINRNLSQQAQFKPYFNLKTLQCQACNKIETNNPHKCLDIVTPVTPLNCTNPSPVLNTVTNKCEACKVGTFWINATKKCDVCSNTTVYNDKTQACDACKAGTFWINATKKCDVCSNTTVYNEKTQACKACASGFLYNANTKLCQRWVTNVASLNDNYIQEDIWTKENLNKTIEDSKKVGSVNICSTNTPFYSQTHSKCINCVNPAPYFNLHTQVCQNCENYKVDTNVCLQALPRFNMKVQDFYGTIFG